MSEYRVALVGLSGIGMNPAAAAPEGFLGTVQPYSHVAAFAASPWADVVAVCDVVPAAIARFKGTWGARYPNTKTYTDYRQMLAEEHVDLLFVATPDHLHADIVVHAAESGVKGILCEKPIATTIADTERMIAACERNHVVLSIEHTRRFNAEYVEARRLVRSGAIGPVRSVRALLGGPRAMLFRNGTHVVDALCYFADAAPTWLVGRLSEENAGYGPRYAGDGGKDPSLDPGCDAYVEFANGVRGYLIVSKAISLGWEIEVTGETGRIRMLRTGGELELFQDSGAVAVTPFAVPDTTRGSILGAVTELKDLVSDGGTGVSTGADGRRVLSIMLGVLQSSHAGGTPVTFPVVDV